VHCVAAARRRTAIDDDDANEKERKSLKLSPHSSLACLFVCS
jgi:hypothetical protein